MEAPRRSGENYDFLEEVLDGASRVHEGYRDRVDFDAEDRAHAIYLLQGTAIVNAFAAVESARSGFRIQVLATTRFILECIEVMDFFASLEDDDRRLRAWFRGEVADPPDPSSRARKFEDHLAALKRVFSLADETQLRAIQEFQQTRWHEFSKFAHPTIRAARGNMTRGGSFSYRSTLLRGGVIENFNFATFVLKPALMALGLYVDVIRPTPDEFERLTSLLDKLG